MWRRQQIASRCFLTGLLIQALAIVVALDDARATELANPPSMMVAQAMSERQGTAFAARIKGLQKQVPDLIDAGQYQQAEALLRQIEDLVGQLPEHTGGLRWRRGAMLSGAKEMLGKIRFQQGRFAEAEKAYRDALDSVEQEFGRDSDSSITFLTDIATMRMRQGKTDGAEDLLLKALKLAQTKVGPNSGSAAETLSGLAMFYYSTGQFDKAAPLLDRSIAILDTGHTFNERLEAAQSRDNLASVEKYAGRISEARTHYEQAYAVEKGLLGPNHPITLKTQSNLGVLLRDMGAFEDGRAALAHVQETRLRLLGPDNPDSALSFNNLGWLENADRKLGVALPLFRQSLQTYLKLLALRSGAGGLDASGVSERELGRAVLGLTTAAWGATLVDPTKALALRDESFLAAQSAHRGDAARALARTTARLAASNQALAALIREQQDLAGNWGKITAWLTAALAQPAERRNGAAEQQQKQALVGIEGRIGEIAQHINRDFPAYESLADPAPLSIPEVQKLLRPNEVLVAFSVFRDNMKDDAVFVWFVGQDGATWKRIGTAPGLIAGLVGVLRCGLDVGSWDNEDSANRCKNSLEGHSYDPQSDDPQLPFDAGTAYRLWDTLFGGIEPLLKGKSLLIVAPAPLASLPFQVLVTQKPAQDWPDTTDDYRALAWLGRQNPISVLPSVASLRGLRAQASLPSAPQAYIGFGDPALVGTERCGKMTVATECPTQAQDRAALETGRARQIDAARKSPAPATYLRSGFADVAQLRKACPLPDTALELNCVATSLGAGPQFVHTRSNATETLLKKEPLDRYRVIHFATHGLLASDTLDLTGTLSEPSLVLTPPDVASDEDDGLLTASEIAELKLNADWVVLSACNTAAGANEASEPLSGLARAFFYAGAHALLVSHWPVGSDAAVRLTTGAFDEMRKSPGIGRGEAMRRSMATLIDHGPPFEVHPTYWAPFSVVGEGGADVH